MCSGDDDYTGYDDGKWVERKKTHTHKRNKSFLFLLLLRFFASIICFRVRLASFNRCQRWRCLYYSRTIGEESANSLGTTDNNNNNINYDDDDNERFVIYSVHMTLFAVQCSAAVFCLPANQLCEKLMFDFVVLVVAVVVVVVFAWVINVSVDDPVVV